MDENDRVKRINDLGGYQAIFNAIADAVTINKGGSIGISINAFIEALPDPTKIPSSGGFSLRRLMNKVIDAVYSELPKERWSCSDDTSGTGLTISRQRNWSAEAVRKVFSDSQDSLFQDRTLPSQEEANRIIDDIAPAIMESHRAELIETRRSAMKRFYDRLANPL